MPKYAAVESASDNTLKFLYMFKKVNIDNMNYTPTKRLQHLHVASHSCRRLN